MMIPASILATLRIATLAPVLSLAGPADLAASAASLAACCDVLAEWCRAHGIRQVWLAPGLLADPTAAPRGFAPGADGLLHRSLVPTPKQLG